MVKKEANTAGSKAAEAFAQEQGLCGKCLASTSECECSQDALDHADVSLHTRRGCGVAENIGNIAGEGFYEAPLKEFDGEVDDSY